MEKIKFILSGLWEFLRPFILQLMSEAGMILAQAAMTAVAAVATSMQDADGTTKRTQAFDLIETEMKRAGVTMAASTINAAIEAAVVKLKATVP